MWVFPDYKYMGIRETWIRADNPDPLSKQCAPVYPFCMKLELNGANATRPTAIEGQDSRWQKAPRNASNLFDLHSLPFPIFQVSMADPRPPRKHKCSRCGRHYSSSSHLRRHEATRKDRGGDSALAHPITDQAFRQRRTASKLRLLSSHLYPQVTAPAGLLSILNSDVLAQ